jgi:methylmalonic aciduria homocystinuria type C protein
MSLSANQILSDLRATLQPAGLDLVHNFQVGTFNAEVETNYQLPDFGSTKSLGVLVGNGSALWRPFLRALGEDPGLAENPDPINAYVEQICLRAVEPLNLDLHIRYAHDVGDKLVPMQRLAHLSGLAHLGPAQLNVHREFGPWLALRAVILFDVPGARSKPAPDFCTACDKPCLVALEYALAQTENTECADPNYADPDYTNIKNNWQAWVAVRDACPMGQDHRYTEDQIRYHYEKDRNFLRRLINL